VTFTKRFFSHLIFKECFSKKCILILRVKEIKTFMKFYKKKVFKGMYLGT